jgi:hypothetical protein
MWLKQAINPATYFSLICFFIPSVEPEEYLYVRRRIQVAPLASDINILLRILPEVDRELAKHETPIQFRLAQYLGVLWWNCVAVYSENFKDTLTFQKPVVAVPNSNQWNSANRALCAVQATTTYVTLSFPGAKNDVVNALAEIGITVESQIRSSVANCNTVTCLQNQASVSSYDPITMGQIVAKQVYDYSISDGFNQLGKDDGCTVNCRPYNDVTGYEPVRSISGNRIDRWQPLVESNGKGYFTIQQHITPHIGAKAKFRNLPESDRFYRNAPPTSYSKSRKSEALVLISAMRALNDTQKIEVEVFDDKLMVANAVARAFLNNLVDQNYQDSSRLGNDDSIVSFERFVHFLNSYLSAEYDAIVIAWKEKVKYDLIRPISVIKRWGDTMITTWAPGGVKTFPAYEFEAYRRVMPHSEYVSGTSCLFETTKSLIMGYMLHLGLDPSFPISFFPYQPGSSRVEPGITPSETVTLSYSSIAEMAEAGSVSRLHGGIHFANSITAGKSLCIGIGDVAMAKMILLYN